MTIRSSRARRLASVHFGNAHSVTGFARRRRWLVEQHHVSVHRLLQRVARGTGNIFMTSRERENCLAVIEERWPPFIGVVTSCAVVSLGAELIGMWVFVAFHAGLRGIGELHVD